MSSVSAFLENAQRILATATGGSEELAILIDASGAIHMIAGADWPLDRLMAHHGAREGFRVSRQSGTVRVDGRSRTESCSLASGGSRLAPPSWMQDRPAYSCLTAAAPRMLTA